MGAHGMSEFDPHMTQAAQADDPDFLTRTDLPVAQWGIGGDAGAEQGCGSGRVKIFGNAQHEALIDRDLVGIAAEGEGVGRPADLVFAAIGSGKAVFAILFQPFFAGVAMTAAIDQTTDSDQIAGLE